MVRDTGARAKVSWSFHQVLSKWHGLSLLLSLILACYLWTVRSIINDTYRSQLCLLHPPHLIAIAAIFLSFIIHPPVRPEPQLTPTDADDEVHRPPRRSSRQASHNIAALKKQQSHQPQDPIAFLAELNVSLPLVASISQEIISLYALWDQYKEDVTPDASKLAKELGASSPAAVAGSALAVRPTKGRSSSRSDSQSHGSQYQSQSQSSVCTPGTDTNETLDTISIQESRNGSHITPAFLSALLMKMRETKVLEMTPSPPPSATRTKGGSIPGRQMAVNKRLERTQATG
jgi:cyclin C